MEALILIHSNQRIFWRDHLPSDPGQYSRSYERATGVSEMMAQRTASMSRPIIRPRNVEKRGIAPVSIVSEQYHQRFCFAHTRPIDTLPQVEALLNNIADQEIESSLSGLRLLEATNGPSNGKSQSRITNGESSPSIANGEGRSTMSTGAMSIYQPQDQNRAPGALTAQFQRTHALTNT
jgi:hypothetical protein